MIDRSLIIRASVLYIPAVLAIVLCAVQKVPRSRAAGILLACCWNAVFLFCLHSLAINFHWWSYEVSGGEFYAFPVDLYLGWVILWGILPSLVFAERHLALVTLAFFCADLLLMPLCFPVVKLGENWLIGEGLALILCLIPSQLLARWTEKDLYLPQRAFLQVLAFGGIFILLLPAIAVSQGSRSLSETPISNFPPYLKGIVMQVVLIPALLGLSAVQEFVTRGKGTPIPYDSPKRLVTSGVYAYTANPMQVSMTLLLLGVGALLLNGWMVLAAGISFIYSAGIARWDEEEYLKTRFGTPWCTYRENVQSWRIRFRPWYPPAGQKPLARLYVAKSCGICSQVASWFSSAGCTGLQIVAAEEHTTRDLDRITYDPRDGSPEEIGIAAIARGLEHIHLGFACVGWFLRLPVVRHFVQLISDATGMGPRTIARHNGVQACPTSNSEQSLTIGNWKVQSYFSGEFF